MFNRAVVAAVLLAAALSASARPFAPPPEVVALRTEIAALELDRALALTPEQARSLLPLLQKGAAEAQSLRARLEQADPALLAALTRARDELRAGGPVSDASRQAIAAARKGEFGEARGATQGAAWPWPGY
jgi:Skp family chaperone for outer membrane proteins